MRDARIGASIDFIKATLNRLPTDSRVFYAKAKEEANLDTALVLLRALGHAEVAYGHLVASVGVLVRSLEDIYQSPCNIGATAAPQQTVTSGVGITRG